jgi:hypothetical protein
MTSMTDPVFDEEPDQEGALFDDGGRAQDHGHPGRAGCRLRTAVPFLLVAAQDGDARHHAQ